MPLGQNDAGNWQFNWSQGDPLGRAIYKSEASHGNAGPRPISDAEVAAWDDERYRTENGRRSWGRSPLEFYGDIDRARAAQGQQAYQTAAAQAGFNQSTQNVAQAREMQEAGRNYQMGQLARMEERAQGKGPSMAEMQYRQMVDAGNAAARSQAASARGGNMLMANRMASQQQALGMQAAAGTAGQLRLQEQLGYEQALNQAATGMRGQDLGVVESQLNERGQNLGRMGMEYGRDSDLWGREMDVKRAQLNADMQQYAADRGYQGQMAGIEANKKGFWDYAMPVVAAGTAGGLMAASDERVKTNVQSGSPAAREMLDSLSAKSFRYRAPGPNEAGERLGIMAQDLERSKAGAPLVHQGPDGVKRVDVPGAAMASLAAVADVHDRLRRLEESQQHDKGRVTRGHR